MIYIYFEFSCSGFPHLEDKRAGISKFQASSFTLFYELYTLVKPADFGFRARTLKGQAIEKNLNSRKFQHCFTHSKEYFRGI